MYVKRNCNIYKMSKAVGYMTGQVLELKRMYQNLNNLNHTTRGNIYVYLELIL